SAPVVEVADHVRSHVLAQLTRRYTHNCEAFCVEVLDDARLSADADVIRDPHFLSNTCSGSNEHARSEHHITSHLTTWIAGHVVSQPRVMTNRAVYAQDNEIADRDVRRQLTPRRYHATYADRAVESMDARVRVYESWRGLEPGADRHGRQPTLQRGIAD